MNAEKTISKHKAAKISHDWMEDFIAGTTVQNVVFTSKAFDISPEDAIRTMVNSVCFWKDFAEQIIKGFKTEDDIVKAKKALAEISGRTGIADHTPEGKEISDEARDLGEYISARIAHYEERATHGDPSA